MAPVNYVRLATHFNEFLDGASEVAGKALKRFYKNKGTEETPIPLVFYFLDTAESIIKFMSLVHERSELMLIRTRSFRSGFITPDTFDSLLSSLRDDFKSFRSEFEILKMLSDEEARRVNESWHSLLEECYYSSILNSAVALESRLWRIMEVKNRKVLESIPKYPKLTLGDLSGYYLKNKNMFDSIIPEEHERVMELVNTYRIFSAHAKKKLVSKTKAEGIFGFVLEFLLDPHCIP